MANEVAVQEFPKVLYKHRDPLTVTVYSPTEQDQYLAEGYSLNHRPQEQIDQDEYLKDHPELAKTSGDMQDAGDWTEQGDGTEYPIAPAEALKEADVDHNHKADIVKQDGQD